MNRFDNRKSDEIRPIEILPNTNRYAEGSVYIKFGHTHLICTATIENTLPKWRQKQNNEGWLTAEYGMLPRSTHDRIRRDKALTGGRTQEISRLIGRSLRSCLDTKLWTGQQAYVDCDVIQADGGTRTAAITGGFVALALALDFQKKQGLISEMPISHYVAAISAGVMGENIILDLNYQEDSIVNTDMNFVFTSKEEFIEIQGTAEGKPFTEEQLQTMIKMVKAQASTILNAQAKALEGVLAL